MFDDGVLVSAFSEGRLAGGRRAEGTFPKLCIPCFRGAAFFCVAGSNVSPRDDLYKLFMSSAANLGLVGFLSPLFPPRVLIMPKLHQRKTFSVSVRLPLHTKKFSHCFCSALVGFLVSSQLIRFLIRREKMYWLCLCDYLLFSFLS